MIPIKKPYFFLILLCLYLEAASANEYKFYKDVTTKIKDPFDMRDPFKRILFKRKSELKKSYAILEEGNVFSNLPTIENVPLSHIRVVGILLGKERRAMAKLSSGAQGAGKETYILKEGMKLGENQAELKAILPGGIVVVEKLKDVYDKDEFIETLIPVSPE
jgi:type IV pilus assembly protein PilP